MDTGDEWFCVELFNFFTSCVPRPMQQAKFSQVPKLPTPSGRTKTLETAPIGPCAKWHTKGGS